MLVTAYHTGGRYTAEAIRLAKSCDRFGVEVDIHVIPSRGNWYDNTRYKADFLRQRRRSVSGPILWVDCDAVVHADLGPHFDNLDADIAAHYLRGSEFLTGTLWLADTDPVRTMLDRWCNYNDIRLRSGRPRGGGQKNLAAVVASMQEKELRVHRLPPELCYIFDISRRVYPDAGPPVIEHLQASRENRPGREGDHPGRQRRIAELERWTG